MEDIFKDLFEIIKSREKAHETRSYTASLFSGGRGKICKKFGEEAIETIVAALNEKKADVVYESADTLFHLLVLWAQMNIDPKEVAVELKRRFGTSGLKEKHSR